MKILVPVGTRPEIVKLAPVVAALRTSGIETVVVATGQHHDPALSGDVFRDLGLAPDIVWALSGGESDRIGQLLRSAFNVVVRERPDVVLLLGDTNTVPLFCLAARRACTPIVHLEAGLRSRNPTSMEEVNRQVAGALASLHLAPTELSAKFLREEGVVEERIRVVGNPIIDVLRTSRRTPVALEARRGVVVTAHRATNVDDQDRLHTLVRLLHRLTDEIGEVTFPIHPRTRQRLEAADLVDELNCPGIRATGPVPWERMVDLVAASQVVVTDSGGLQEEASFFGVPVVVLRRSTPRWESVQCGISTLTGLEVDRAVTAATHFCLPEVQARVAATPCPYGDGRTAERVVSLLHDRDALDLLTLCEPDFIDQSPQW